MQVASLSYTVTVLQTGQMPAKARSTGPRGRVSTPNAIAAFTMSTSSVVRRKLIPFSTSGYGAINHWITAHSLSTDYRRFLGVLNTTPISDHNINRIVPISRACLWKKY